MDDFLEIVGLSIGVSLAATAIAAGVGVLFGAALAIFPFPGRRLVIVLINAFFGLPPVVVGLVLYLALSRSGPLGFLELLFTPTAMVIPSARRASPERRDRNPSRRPGPTKSPGSKYRFP